MQLDPGHELRRAAGRRNARAGAGAGAAAGAAAISVLSTTGSPLRSLLEQTILVDGRRRAERDVLRLREHRADERRRERRRGHRLALLFGQALAVLRPGRVARLIEDRVTFLGFRWQLGQLWNHRRPPVCVELAEAATNEQQAEHVAHDASVAPEWGRATDYLQVNKGRNVRVRRRTLCRLLFLGVAMREDLPENHLGRLGQIFGQIFCPPTWRRYGAMIHVCFARTFKPGPKYMA